jgi:hypothetical protein
MPVMKTNGHGLTLPVRRRTAQQPGVAFRRLAGRLSRQTSDPISTGLTFNRK